MDIVAPWRPYYPNLAPLLDLVARASYWERRLYLKTQHYPRFLYKYRAFAPADDDSVKRLRDIIVESKFWLSSPSDFNDPFDMSAKLIVEGSFGEKVARFENLVAMHSTATTLNQRRRMVATLAKRSNLETLQQTQAAHDEALQGAGVYAFAGDPKSILMWSHYGSHHTGVCLQFEVAKDTTTLMRAAKIEYADTYPIINWMDETAEQLKKSLLRKESGWRYEKERRIITPHAAHTYMPFRNEALTGIILGCRSPDATRRKIDDLLAERAALGFPVPALYLARKHPSKYALVMTRC